MQDSSGGNAPRPVSDGGFRLAFDEACDACFITDDTGTFVAVNRRACELLGYDFGQLEGRDECSIMRPEDAAARIAGRAALGPEVAIAESLLLHRDGSLLDTERTSRRLPDGRIWTTVRDLGPSRRDQRELDRARGALRSLVNALPNPAFIIDRDYTILMCNEALARSLVRSIDAIVGKSMNAILPPAVAEARSWRLRDVFETGAPHVFDDSNGGRHYRNHLYPVVGDGGVERIAVFAIDVTEVHLAEAELRLSEERMRATIDGRPDVAVQWYDQDGRVRLWNRASEQMFGFSSEEAVGKRLDALIYAPEQQREFDETLAQIARTGESFGPLELSFRRRDGTTGTCLSTIFQIPGQAGEPYFVCMDVDLTEHKRVESELRQAQRLEVLGRLAGGMAHDFNNLLTAIAGFAELGLAGVPGGSEPAECLDFVLEAARRGAALTASLLAFAGKRVVAPRPIVLREVVDRVAPMMRPLVGDQDDFVLDHDASSEQITIDLVSLEQLIMNLIVNARDAMPGGGKLTITTRTVSLTPYEEPGVPAGRYALMRVSDTGVGIPPEQYQRVFEPFFKSQSVSRGTGLGLASCAGIVRQAGGYIGVESSPSGTTFKVHLPVSHQVPMDPPAPVRPRETDKGGETVLLVEDELAVRLLMQRVLRSLGYVVLVAADGHEALTVASEHPGRIDVLLTDVVMPGMGGIELADALLRLRPETKVLLCSGYASDLETAGRGYPLLAKPYTPALLARQIRVLLDD